MQAMDELSKERLDRIRTKTVGELRADEIAFLRARRTYLTLDDKDKFGSILKDELQKKSKKEKAKK